VTSIIRCVKIPLITSEDATFEAGQLAVWTVAEIATTIMASSIPVLRLFVKKAMSSEEVGLSKYQRSTFDGTFKHSRSHTTIITARTKSKGGRRKGTSRTLSTGALSEYELGLNAQSATNGAIVKVETVTVKYGLRSPGAPPDELGIELERVPERDMIR
jgi:hypothetical protein